jgi:hypothetical protein
MLVQFREQQGPELYVLAGGCVGDDLVLEGAAPSQLVTCTDSCTC